MPDSQVNAPGPDTGTQQHPIEIVARTLAEAMGDECFKRAEGDPDAWMEDCQEFRVYARHVIVALAPDPAEPGIRVAKCEGVNEPDGTPCPGYLAFRPGASQARCSDCGGWCGSLVARYVDQPAPSGELREELALAAGKALAEACDGCDGIYSDFPSGVVTSPLVADAVLPAVEAHSYAFTAEALAPYEARTRQLREELDAITEEWRRSTMRLAREVVDLGQELNEARAEVERLKPGARVVDGGVMGTLIRCHLCGGDGLLHDPDVRPESVEPVRESAAPAGGETGEQA